MSFSQPGAPGPNDFESPDGGRLAPFALAALAAAATFGAFSYRRLAARLQRLEGSAPPVGSLEFERYALLANHTRDIVYFADAQNRIVEANAAAARAYGYAPDELIGLDLVELQSRDTREAAMKAIARPRASETVVLETKHRRKNGAQFPVELTLTAASGTPEILAIVRDVSERQNADDAMSAAYASAVEASRLKAEFVAAMGHEIRTPMNTIMGMSELMLDTELTLDQRAFSTGIRHAGKALLAIIDDVLDFTQMESGGPEFELADVDVPATIESVVASFARRAADAGLSLATRIDPKVDLLVRADATRIRQVIARLIDNALKFTERGTVVVAVALEARDDWSATLRFAVEDSGPGVDESVAKAIFEPFQQADRSATRRHAGTGLGLPIAGRLVELMGGTLGLESIPGEGATFWFSARFDRSQEDTQTQLASVSGARLLVIDDDPMTREIIERYAQSWDMTCRSAANGTEALAMLREAAGAQAPYDVAIVDYSMPGGMGGLELGMRIKGEPGIADTGLILITAYKDLQQRQAVSAAGFTAFLAKPLDRGQLFECVARAVRRSRVSTAGARRERVAHDASDGREKRILLVEDHPVNQQLGVQQIKKLGFDATAVSNGEQALAALAADDYDLVFMDCQMPTMDGFAATRALRTSEEGTGRHVTVVAMTANALVEDRRRCIAAGMDDYLAKPVQVEDIQTMIERWIWDGAAV
jgi:two-component system sensor histidine kinase/response regulator